MFLQTQPLFTILLQPKIPLSLLQMGSLAVPSFQPVLVRRRVPVRWVSVRRGDLHAVPPSRHGHRVQWRLQWVLRDGHWHWVCDVLNARQSHCENAVSGVCYHCRGRVFWFNFGYVFLFFILKRFWCIKVF